MFTGLEFVWSGNSSAVEDICEKFGVGPSLSLHLLLGSSSPGSLLTMGVTWLDEIRRPRDSVLLPSPALLGSFNFSFFKFPVRKFSSYNKLRPTRFFSFPNYESTERRPFHRVHKPHTHT